jgi:sarcosine oxidase subunit delta
MHLIPCPHCGPRDEAEFSYRGDATLTRPDPTAPIEAFVGFVYVRKNPRGWHLEWWQHTGGCRQLVKVLRHTVTHVIAATAAATDRLDLPTE